MIRDGMPMLERKTRLITNFSDILHTSVHKNDKTCIEDVTLKTNTVIKVSDHGSPEDF